MEQRIEITAIELEAQNLPALVQSFGTKIETEDTLKRVNDAKLGIRKLRGKIRSVFEPLKTNAYSSYKGIMEQWKEIEAPALEAENVCDRLLSFYFAEQRQAREEAEIKRLDEIRKQKEEEERLFLEALNAEAEGDKEKAERIINEVAIQENDAKPTVVVPEKPKLDNIHSRIDYDIEIVDEILIPRPYLMVNETMIRRIVKASKGKTVIPGVKNIVKDIVVTRK